MKSFDKGSVVFKHRADDFIVEEINEDLKISRVSDSVNAFEKAEVDFSNIDVDDRRDFIMLDVEKLNIDHFSLISILCNELKKQPHEIGYAGTKDKLAWTCQRISIFKPDMEKIRKFSHKGIILKNFRWGKHKIKIGDLKGNRFRVTLRDVDDAAIKVLNRVRNTEFIPNFFGTQRFGSLRNDNFQIGKLILKKKYKEAVFAYLTGSGHSESREIKEAKKRLKSERDISSAAEYFPRELHIENKMIEYLSKNKNDYLGALTFIGEKIILIMCQSVQSRLFNEILERLIDRRAISEEDSLIIPGYELNNSHGKFRKITENILEENDLELDDFKNNEVPFLSLATGKRKAFFKVIDINIDVEDDELFIPSKKIKLQFTFDSGSYATIFLEYFFNI